MERVGVAVLPLVPKTAGKGTGATATACSSHGLKNL
jgi:hypothetical protein